MATYTVESEGNHIVPMQLQVTFPVDITATYVSVEGTSHEYESQDFNDLMDLVSSNTENYYKTLPEFTTPDETRNVTWSCVLLGPEPGNETKILYTTTVTFTIEGAEIQITHNTQTDLTGTAKDEFLQSEADAVAISFKAGRSWTDL